MAGAAVSASMWQMAAKLGELRIKFGNTPLSSCVVGYVKHCRPLEGKSVQTEFSGYVKDQREEFMSGNCPRTSYDQMNPSSQHN